MVILENIDIDVDKAILQNIESIQIWHIEQGYDRVSNLEEGQRLLLMQPQVLKQLQFRFAQLPQRPLS